MATTIYRARRVAAPLLVALMVLGATACAPGPSGPPYYGIYFYPPGVGYIGKVYTPEATATSGLPVSFALDASSTGCTYIDGLVAFNSEGTCVINANQPGDETHEPSAQVQAFIPIHPCPPMIPGLWTGPLGLSANVNVSGNMFYGIINLTSLGYGIQQFNGTVACEVASMTFNSTPLVGWLSWDGKTLSSSYNGIAIVLNAPPTP